MAIGGCFSGWRLAPLTGIGSHIEVGYVFHRLIRLSSTGENTQVGNTAMVRAGVNF